MFTLCGSRSAETRARSHSRTAAALLVSVLAGTAGPANAALVTQTYVGTLSNPLTAFGAVPANNPGGVARGNKYVIQVSFETSDMVAVAASGRDFQSRDFNSVSLDDAPGGSNTFALFIPSEGFGGVLTQAGTDHFALSGGSAQTAEIHFFNPCTSAADCAAQFRGFEFESNFIRANSPAAPDPNGDIIFELRDQDPGLSGTTITTQGVNVLDGDAAFALQGIMFNGGTVDVRSESNAPSGGQQNPGVFLSPAVEVIAQAGSSPLAYSAADLSVTTDGGTEMVTEVPAQSSSAHFGPHRAGSIASLVKRTTILVPGAAMGRTSSPTSGR